MRDRLRQQWERLGREDPYWAVLARPGKKGGRWDSDDFFATGRLEVAALLEQLAAMDLTVNRAVALDFGCGVGRLSRALAEHFDHVIGVDIAESMLAEARRANRDLGNVDFRHNTGTRLAGIGDRSIDFIYSNITLQHIPAARQLEYIAEFGRVLRPGGVLVFQTPDRPNLRVFRGWLHRILGNRVLNVFRRIVFGAAGVMEMHTLRRERAQKKLGELGLSIVDVHRSEAAGRAFVGYRYFATLDASG